MSTRFGLQTKIIVIFAVSMIVVVGVSTAIAMLLTRQLVEEAIYRRVLAQARATAHQVAATHDLENADELLPLLKQLQHDFPGVRQSYVYLHARPDRLLVATDPQGQHSELDRTPHIESYFEFERPDENQLTIETPDGKNWIMSTEILDHNRSVGCLNLVVSKSSAYAVINGLVRRNLMLMVASLIVVGLVFHFFFLRNVRGRVRELVRVMLGAEGGQLDIRAQVGSQDEIGQLAEHLNQMLDRVRNFQSELARKVSEATAELARRNEELTRINEELFDTQKQLARSGRLAVAGQLAASLAHEIGTPLNSISGHVQLMARRKGMDTASVRRLEIIEQQIENIVRTVKQLLSWTRKFDLRLEPVDLRRVLEDCVLLSSPTLESKHIRVRTEFASPRPSIYGDAGYLHQVFLNLINNSIDAMPRGGKLTIRTFSPLGGGALYQKVPGNGAGEVVGRAVAVEVADTGEGIAPEVLAHIFDPMFTTKRMGTGAGLGLAICKQIVEQHAGVIHAASEVHRGTCFTVVLPEDCRRTSEVPAGEPRVAAPVA
jgi:two-component system, NtrC family, sensor kinase